MPSTSAVLRPILDPSYAPAVTDTGMYMLRFRYLLRRDDGSFEEPADMFRRVAWNLAAAERIFRPDLTDEALLGCADDFFSVMAEFRFLPNAPTLLGAGGPLQQLSACYVLPISDSVDGIFETLRKTAIIHSKGSGTGFSFSGLRPRGAAIATGGVSTGPVSFLRIFDAETEIIKQGGTGWGANMGVLRCDHPDIREFVTAKSTGHGLQNFNLSVGVTDAFMKAARGGGEYLLLDPHTGRPCGSENAGDLLDVIAAEAWRTGDPGLLFLDQIERGNPTPVLGRIEATNPCGEAPLLPYEACWLGGVNVAAHLDPTTREISWSALRETCHVAARLMDDAIEVSRYPLPEIGEATRRTRKLGIGVMGFADLLIRMNIRYGSEQSEALARRLMREIKSHLDEASQVLASERGVFPAFSQSVFADRGVARRNATVTANAPNSTIAAIAGCSSGVEPLFSICFEKVLANGDRLQQASPDFERVAVLRGFASDQLFAEIRAGASIQDAPVVPQDVKEVFVTAHDLTVEEHIRIQAAFQESTDLAVAKTVNLPHGATPLDVRRAFESAWRAGCKGVTCFRDGCRESSFLEARSRPLACSGPECAIC